jgi:circadian clock protein KaiC
MPDRIKTGIAGFAKMLPGGFLDGDAVMLAGSAGMGKTTFALEYLVNGATKFGQRGLYISFEQLPEQIYRDAKSFGWDLRRLEEEDKLRVICTSPELVFSSSAGRNILDKLIGEIHPRRIVIDSLNHIAMFVDDKELRRETYALIMYLKAKGLSSLMTFEAPPSVGGVDQTRETAAGFLLDSIVLLKPVEIESSMRRAVVILKMRGSDHDAGLNEYRISGTEGIVVMEPFKNYENIMSGSARRTIADEIVNSWRSNARKRTSARERGGSR